MALVFVYGTLKRNGRNHHKLLNSSFIGEGLTCPMFEMKNLDRASGIVEGRNRIHGELFEVDSDTLHELDKLEKLGWVYERRRTYVYVAGVQLICWIYVYKHKLLASFLDYIYRSNFKVTSYDGIDFWKNCL